MIVCDKCKGQDAHHKFIETKSVSGFVGSKTEKDVAIRLDLCDKCLEELKQNLIMQYNKDEKEKS